MTSLHRIVVLIFATLREAQRPGMPPRIIACPRQDGVQYQPRAHMCRNRNGHASDDHETPETTPLHFALDPWKEHTACMSNLPFPQSLDDFIALHIGDNVLHKNPRKTLLWIVQCPTLDRTLRGASSSRTSRTAYSIRHSHCDSRLLLLSFDVVACNCC